MSKPLNLDIAPFDYNNAPEGFLAQPGSTCRNCAFELPQNSESAAYSQLVGDSCLATVQCFSQARPDKTSVIFATKDC